MNPRLFKERTILLTLYGFTISGCLVLAAILEGGLLGISKQLELGEETKLATLDQAPMLPASLPESMERFRNSEIAASIFGADFVSHYTQIREEEWSAFEAWCKEEDVKIDHNGPDVTDWEYRHYFDWL